MNNHKNTFQHKLWRLTTFESQQLDDPRKRYKNVRAQHRQMYRQGGLSMSHTPCFRIQHLVFSFLHSLSLPLSSLSLSTVSPRSLETHPPRTNNHKTNNTKGTPLSLQSKRQNFHKTLLSYTTKMKQLNP